MEHKPLTIECNVQCVNLRAVSYDCTVFIAIELWKQDWGVSECSHLYTKAGGNYICVIPCRCLHTNSENPPEIYSSALVVLSAFLVPNLNLPCHKVFSLLHVLSTRHKKNSLFFSSLYFNVVEHLSHVFLVSFF